MCNARLQKIGCLTLACALLLSAGLASAVGANTAKKALGKPPPGSTIIVSPKGQHVAWKAMQGSRAIMVVDGVAGPPVDELLLKPSGGSVAFSNEGSRYAYFGRNGGNYVLIVDGRKLAEGPYSSPYRLSNMALSFSPGGKHVYFMESTTNRGRRLVINGKPGPWSSANRLGVVFSPNDRRYAYNAPEYTNKHAWFTVVDGKKLSFLGNTLKFTSGNRLINSMPAPGGAVMLVSGVPVLKAAAINKIWVAPTGPHIAAQIQPKSGAAAQLYIDGQPVANAIDVKDVVFSPDGKHYAAICEAGIGRNFVVVDGKKGREYQTIDQVLFTADSNLVLYTAYNASKRFVVANHKEFGAYQGLLGNLSADSGLTMSKVGGHYLFVGESGSNAPQELVKDGKATTSTKYRINTLPRLSDNGRHYAFAAAANSYSVDSLVIDGKPLANVKPIKFQAWPGAPQTYPIPVRRHGYRLAPYRRRSIAVPDRQRRRHGAALPRHARGQIRRENPAGKRRHVIPAPDQLDDVIP